MIYTQLTCTCSCLIHTINENHSYLRLLINAHRHVDVELDKTKNDFDLIKYRCHTWAVTIGYLFLFPSFFIINS